MGDVRTVTCMEWQPIETAPKAGTKFMVGAWLDQIWNTALVFGWSDRMLWETGRELNWHPTHWLPLLAAPPNIMETADVKTSA